MNPGPHGLPDDYPVEKPSAREAHEQWANRWWEWTIVNNQPVAVEHRVDVVGCNFCGWEIPVWPEDAEFQSEFHQANHRKHASKALVRAFANLDRESAEVAYDIVIAALTQ